AGHSDRLSDYLRRLDFDPAFEYLRGFTFSEAMLGYLNLYLLVGAPVAVVLAVLEHGRVRWLQALAVERLPGPEAQPPPATRRGRARICGPWPRLWRSSCPSASSTWSCPLPITSAPPAP
ncbi:unnamed protein product, partial [Prorocentrum cordatum]